MFSGPCNFIYSSFSSYMVIKPRCRQHPLNYTYQPSKWFCITQMRPLWPFCDASFTFSYCTYINMWFFTNSLFSFLYSNHAAFLISFVILASLPRFSKDSKDKQRVARGHQKGIEMKEYTCKKTIETYWIRSTGMISKLSVRIEVRNDDFGHYILSLGLLWPKAQEQ